VHDIDRTQTETWETYETGPTEFGYEANPQTLGGYAGEMESEYSGEGEYFGESEYVGEYAGEGPVGEALELELTAELLEVTNEEELDRFLGGLFKTIGRGVGQVIRGPVGSSLGGLLKGVAKKFLPVVGGALGSFVAPGVGTAAGASLASAAGRAFGLELEGLSGEDREFEIARNYVRLASAAAQEAAIAPPMVSPQAVAQRAMSVAAQRYAPGLVSAAPQPAGVPSANGGQHPHNGAGRMPPDQRQRTGRWIRRGQHILLIGAYHGVGKA
jgi:uncharacterized protein (DUF697 family)